MSLSWFDVVILGIVVFSLIKGYVSGLVMQLASLIGLIVCAVFSGQIATMISPYILDITGASPHIIKPLSYLMAFLLIIIAFLFAGKLIEGFLKAIKINSLNKLSGALFSVAKWLIGISILLNIVIGMDKNKRIIKADIREKSYTYPYIRAIAPYFIPFLGFDFAKD